MAGEAYYIRTRGKITGPFDLSSLQKLVRRGVLSRMQEISSDRISWASAGDFGELFAARVSSSKAEGSPGGSDQSATGQSSAAVAGVKFFYAQNGVTVGPVPLAVLVSLTQNGTLKQGDFCWQEGSEMALPASHLPALAEVFATGGPFGNAGHQLGSYSQSDRIRARQILDGAFSFCQITGVVAGFVLLLFLDLPLGANREGSIWWWDALKSTNAQPVVVLCFFVLLGGLAAASVGMFVKGLVRGWIFLGLSVLSFILIFVALENALSDGAELFFSLASLYLAAALIGTSYFRSKAPDAKIGMVFQPIFGGLLLLSIVVLTILGLARDAGAQSELFGPDNLPGWAVLVIAAAVIGSVCATVSGILGLIGARRHISGNLYRSTAGFAIASIGIPFIAAMVWVCEYVNLVDVDQKGMWVFVAFRICGIFCAFLALLAVGLMEVLTTIRFSPIALTNRQT